MLIAVMVALAFGAALFVGLALYASWRSGRKIPDARVEGSADELQRFKNRKRSWPETRI